MGFYFVAKLKLDKQSWFGLTRTIVF
jgi:hypothetical protein